MVYYYISLLSLLIFICGYTLFRNLKKMGGIQKIIVFVRFFYDLYYLFFPFIRIIINKF